MSRRAFAFRLIYGLAFVLPASAHHSHGQYQQYFVDLEGTVTDVQLINPHSWVYLDVTDEKVLRLHGRSRPRASPDLARLGVARGYVKPGDTIKVRCHPARDGSEGCLLGFVQAADGSIKDWDGGQALPVDDGFFDLKK